MGTDTEKNQSRAIVAFDFDGTLTVRDSTMAFLRWRAGPLRYGLGLAGLAPAAGRYLSHRDRGLLKAAAMREFLKGSRSGDLDSDAEAFAAASYDRLLRPDALATWGSWGERGALRVIVSASPETVVAPFASRLGAERLFGTRLAFDDQGRATGDLATPNCRGPEKVRRLVEAFGPDVRLAAAYGDTNGDREMLAMAAERGYRVFRGRP